MTIGRRTSPVGDRQHAGSSEILAEVVIGKPLFGSAVERIEDIEEGSIRVLGASSIALDSRTSMSVWDDSRRVPGVSRSIRVRPWGSDTVSP